MELADLRKRKIELERAAEKIITEETKETVATEVESLMDDGSSESKSADSDYEGDDIQGSEDSKDDGDIQYERPVTRSTARESDAESAASGIITRSKDSKLSKEVEEPPPRVVPLSRAHQQPAESPVKAPRPAQEPPKMETPIIPSALPLIMHNPATGQPPNPPQSSPALVPVKRSYQDMSHLIPPFLAPAADPPEKQPALTQPKPAPPKPEPAPPKPAPATAPRSMLKSPFPAQSSLYPPLPQSSLRAPAAASKPPLKSPQGFGGLGDLTGRFGFPQAPHGFDAFGQSLSLAVGMSPGGGPAYPQQRLLPPRPVPMVGGMSFVPPGLQSRALPQGMQGMLQGMQGVPQGVQGVLQGVQGMQGVPMEFGAPVMGGVYPFYPSMMMMPMATTRMAPPVQVSGKVQQGMQQGLPQGLQQGLPQGLQQGLPQTMPQTMPQGIQQTMPQTMQQTMPQTMQQTMPQTMQQTMPQTMQQTMPQTMPHTMQQVPSQPVAVQGQQQPTQTGEMPAQNAEEEQKSETTATRPYMIPVIAADQNGNILPST